MGPLASPVYQFGYDLTGRQTSQTDPQGAVSTRTFNSVGLVLTSSGADPDGAGPCQAPISANTWDVARRLTENVDPGARHTQYQYDSLDRQTSVLDDGRADGPGFQLQRLGPVQSCRVA